MALFGTFWHFLALCMAFFESDQLATLPERKTEKRLRRGYRLVRRLPVPQFLVSNFLVDWDIADDGDVSEGSKAAKASKELLAISASIRGELTRVLSGR